MLREKLRVLYIIDSLKMGEAKRTTFARMPFTESPREAPNLFVGSLTTENDDKLRSDALQCLTGWFLGGHHHMPRK